jgi:hypothetical protein
MTTMRCPFRLMVFLSTFQSIQYLNWCHPGEPRSGLIRDLLNAGGAKEIPDSSLRSLPG